MTYRQDVTRGRDIIARWCDLAERRLEYLTELFETGRWRRFHSEAAFLDNIREAKAAVDTWRDLLTREASRDNYALDVSWLGRGKPALPVDAKPRRVQPTPHAVATEWPQPITAAAIETVRVSPRASTAETTAAPAIDLAAFERELSSIFRREPEPAVDDAYELPLDVSELPLDISSIQQRYPLLRNAL